MSVAAIVPSQVLYIKLGRGGKWESDCLIRDQVVRLGYREVPHNLCAEREWNRVKECLGARYSTSQAVSFVLNQIKDFYLADERTLWITFFGGRLWWCFSSSAVEPSSDGNSRVRRVIGEWSSKDIFGRPLLMNELSGKLTAKQGFRGVICSVDFKYVVNRINGILPTEVQEALGVRQQLEDKIRPLIQSLHWHDFEILADLIFRQAGWQRVSVLGGTEKTLDLELVSPLTDERFGVQVKSESDLAEFQEYQLEFAAMPQYKRFYFVVHSPAADLAAHPALTGSFELLLPQHLAQWVVKYGLVDWVIRRAS